MRRRNAWSRLEQVSWNKCPGTSDETNMQDVNVENQILIIGAGPAGLALAAELSRLGVKPLIIDRQAAGANTSRACVVHARTMDVLEPLGVTRDLLAEGVKVHIFRIRDRDRPLLTIDFSNIPSPYRFTLMIPQNRVEQILLQHLEDMGCRVMRPCELLRFSASARQIEAQAQIDGSTKLITAQWLVGCDGMHSKVRQQSGIAFIGLLLPFCSPALLGAVDVTLARESGRHIWGADMHHDPLRSTRSELDWANVFLDSQRLRQLSLRSLRVYAYDLLDFARSLSTEYIGRLPKSLSPRRGICC